MVVVVDLLLLRIARREYLRIFNPPHPLILYTTSSLAPSNLPHSSSPSRYSLPHKTSLSFVLPLSPPPSLLRAKEQDAARTLQHAHALDEQRFSDMKEDLARAQEQAKVAMEKLVLAQREAAVAQVSGWLTE